MDGAVRATRHKRIGIKSVKMSAAWGALGLAEPVVHPLSAQFFEIFDHDLRDFGAGCEVGRLRGSMW